MKAENLSRANGVDVVRSFDKGERHNISGQSYEQILLMDCAGWRSRTTWGNGSKRPWVGRFLIRIEG